MDNVVIIKNQSNMNFQVVFTENEFNLAAKFMSEKFNDSGNLDNETKLKLYSLYKQVTEGNCVEACPGIFYQVARAKWYSWKSVENMSKDQAINLYINLVNSICPEWLDSFANQKSNKEKNDGSDSSEYDSDEYETDTESECDSNEELKEEEVESKSKSAKQDMSFGIKVSTLGGGKNIDTNTTNVFTLCKQGNFEELLKALDKKHINDVDNKKRSLLHWACDRGNLNIVEKLVELGANINAVDDSGKTPLHYAVCCSYEKIVEFLVKCEASLDHKDDEGKTPLEIAEVEAIRDIMANVKL